MKYIVHGYKNQNYSVNLLLSEVEMNATSSQKIPVRDQDTVRNIAFVSTTLLESKCTIYNHFENNVFC